MRRLLLSAQIAILRHVIKEWDKRLGIMGLDAAISVEHFLVLVRDQAHRREKLKEWESRVTGNEWRTE